MSNKEVFWGTFYDTLLPTVKERGTEFGKAAVDNPEAYLKKLIEELAQQPELDVNQRGFYLTCKRLGIKQTRKAVAAYMEKQ